MRINGGYTTTTPIARGTAPNGWSAQAVARTAAAAFPLTAGPLRFARASGQGQGHDLVGLPADVGRPGPWPDRRRGPVLQLHWPVCVGRGAMSAGPAADRPVTRCAWDTTRQRRRRRGVAVASGCTRRGGTARTNRAGHGLLTARAFAVAAGRKAPAVAGESDADFKISQARNAPARGIGYV